MQVPILNGIYTDEAGDFRTSYPRNYIPVPKKQGISNGYLRPAEGIVANGTGPGIDRGAFNWKGTCYRVMGTSLVSIASDGTTTTIGTIAGSNQVTMHNSFDYLSISGGGNLYLYDGSTIQQNVDPDLGTVLDHIWIDGYFMTTDGTSLVVTELNDPFAVNPLKFGSSEVDPDPINRILKIHDEAYALNRYTIEVFTNIGGNLFPFQRIEGAQIERGTLGKNCSCVFLDAVAFVGGGRREAPAIWLGAGSNTGKISTREIDQILSEYSESTLANSLLETRLYENHKHLMLHLPDQTLVYDAAASQELGQSVWFTLTSSIEGKGKYRATNHIWCYDKWLVGDPTSTSHGYLDDTIGTHYGNENGWDFGTLIIYNNGTGAIFHQLELVALTGRAALGVNPTVWTEYSLDGETWSMREGVSAGLQGDRAARLVWFQQGMMQNFRMQRFSGTSESQMGIARLEIQVEALAA